MAEDKGATAESDPKSLEYWLSRSTDPYTDESTREAAVSSFCERVNVELEGPQIAVRLLAHKVHSPNEAEAMLALELTDACVQRCDERLHGELAKFKFLNELIKLLSPKYLGEQSSKKVKQRITELLYVWKFTLRHLTKIGEAYDMLKSQGVIKDDPTYMDDVIERPAVSAPQSRMASFEDEEKAKLLDSLLRSGNPDDLVVANRLIKSMVKAESQRQEKQYQRECDLKTAANNARLLSEVMAQSRHSVGGITPRDAELMRELYGTLVELRKNLFQYASDVNEGGENALADVLTVNDDVNKVLELYRATVQPLLPKTPPPQPKPGNANEPLVSIGDDAAESEAASSGSRSALAAMVDEMLKQQSQSHGAAAAERTGAPSTADLLAADDVTMLSTGTSPSSHKAARTMGDTLAEVLAGSSHTQSKVLVQRTARPPPDALDQLSDSLMQQHLPGTDRRRAKMALHELSAADASASQTQVAHSSSPGQRQPDEHCVDGSTCSKADGATNGSATAAADNGSSDACALEDVHLTIEQLELSDRPSVTVGETAHVKCALYYADNRPADGVHAALAVVSSANKKAVKSLHFDMHPDEDEEDGAAGSGSCAVVCRRSPQCTDTLAPFNPVSGANANCSYLLLVRPADKRTKQVTVGYSLQFTVGAKERHLTSGTVDLQFL